MTLKGATWIPGCVIRLGLGWRPCHGYTRGQNINRSPADVLSAPQIMGVGITNMAEEIATSCVQLVTCILSGDWISGKHIVRRANYYSISAERLASPEILDIQRAYHWKNGPRAFLGLRAASLLLLDR